MASNTVLKAQIAAAKKAADAFVKKANAIVWGS